MPVRGVWSSGFFCGSSIDARVRHCRMIGGINMLSLCSFMQRYVNKS